MRGCSWLDLHDFASVDGNIFPFPKALFMLKSAKMVAETIVNRCYLGQHKASLACLRHNFSKSRNMQILVEV